VKNLFSELRRRNVFKVTAAYLVVGWVLIQIAELLFPSFGAPDWVLRVFIVLVALGFPLTVIMAWALELTPEGIKSQDSLDEAAAVAPASVERCSIAVLPFNNMSGDSGNDHLADGMSEDLTTFMSRIPGLYVVARNSTFAYKGQSPDIREVGRELDVRYVLEGSVRAMGDVVRIAAQLIEAETGTHLWANNFDANTNNTMAIQDEMLSGIVGAVGSQIRYAEAQRASGIGDGELDAWGWVMRAYWVGRTPTAAAIEQMQLCAGKALEVDPNYAPAYGLMAEAKVLAAFITFTEKARGLREEAFSLARKAEELDGHDPLVLQSSGAVHVNLGDKAAGVAKLEIAVRHNPDSAHATALLAYGLGSMGEFQRAEELFERAFKLSPDDPQTWLYQFWRAVVYTHQPDRLDDAEKLLRTCLARQNNFGYGHIVLAMVLAASDRIVEGVEEIERAREMIPEATFETLAETLRYSASHDRMGEVFVDVFSRVWPQEDTVNLSP
jgi:adenylate cyclase